MEYYVSPYLVEASKRAALIGSKADYNRDDYMFRREQSLYQPPLEKSAALEPSWKVWVAGVLTMVAIAVVIVVF